MRILVDYRPALRARTGVGEYLHELVKAYIATAARPAGDQLVLFSSSWKDWPAPAAVRDTGAALVDSRIPVRLLNLLWHRLEWPPAEFFAGLMDVVHSLHPLLMPARRAAQVVTIHDLFFLSSPERTRAEIRRDYPRLTAQHARRADAVITPSSHVRDLVIENLGVSPEKVYTCRPGAPAWAALPASVRPPGEVRPIPFFGTLEPRKNVGGLLDAYAALLRRRPDAAPLLLAGGATSDSAPWLARIAQPPLREHVTHIGYVHDTERRALYGRARFLVLPSWDEGFGLPVLEAMACGLPVIVSNRGALPEVVGSAGIVVDPDDGEGLAAAIERLLNDPQWAAERSAAALARASEFTWMEAAATLHRAYSEAVQRRASSHAHRSRSPRA